MEALDDIPIEQLYPIPQVARQLSLSPSKVYLMAQRNEIPTVKIGRSIRIPAPEFEAWLAQKVRPAVAED